VEILPPGSRCFFWKGLLVHRLERIDLTAQAALPAAFMVEDAICWALSS